MKLKIKKDEVSKDTKNHLKFRKGLRKMLMQRWENRERTCDIDSELGTFSAFDPLLDWNFRPVCGCEIKGREGLFYDLRHHSLFGKKGHLLYREQIAHGQDGVSHVSEGYELWLLEDLRLVFTYFCTMEQPKTGKKMTYRYPLGKKIPEDMKLYLDDFLEEVGYDVFQCRCAA